MVYDSRYNMDFDDAAGEAAESQGKTPTKCDGNGFDCPNAATEFWESSGPPYDDGQEDIRHLAHCEGCYASIFPTDTVASEPVLDAERASGGTNGIS